MRLATIAFKTVLITAALAAVSGGAVAVQHGHGSVTPEEHYQVIVDRLGLSPEQRETLAGPFQEAFDALEELHRLHDVIAAQLNEDQKKALAEMIHGMLGGAPSAHEHGDPHGDGHPQQ